MTSVRIGTKKKKSGIGAGWKNIGQELPALKPRSL